MLTCTVFASFFLRRAIYTQMQKLPQMEAEKGGAKVTALPVCSRVPTSPTDNCQNILVLTHQNPTHSAKSESE